MARDDEDDLAPEEVDEQEAVPVPGPEDTSILSTEPTGFLHGDEETIERAGSGHE